MLVFLTVLSTLLIHFMKCEETGPIDPIYREFSKHDFNKSRMLSSSSPYTSEEECTIVGIWLFTRHGSKAPAEDIMENIQKELERKILPILQMLYWDEDSKNFLNLQKNQKLFIRRLLNWTNPFGDYSHKELNKLGKTSMKNLGKRLNAELKEFTTTLKKHEIEVLSSSEDRCILSARYFISTFFEGDADDIPIRVADPEDQRLELAKPKEEHVKVIDPLTNTYMDAEEIYYSINCKKTINKIGLKLFPQHIQDYGSYRNILTDEVIKTMYYACAHGFYEKDIFGNKSDAWCHLFDFDDLQMFENMFDIQYHHKNGYHLESNRMLGNAITEDLKLFLTYLTTLT